MNKFKFIFHNNFNLIYIISKLNLNYVKSNIYFKFKRKINYLSNIYIEFIFHKSSLNSNI